MEINRKESQKLEVMLDFSTGQAGSGSQWNSLCWDFIKPYQPQDLVQDSRKVILIQVIWSHSIH